MAEDNTGFGNNHSLFYSIFSEQYKRTQLFIYVFFLTIAIICFCPQRIWKIHRLKEKMKISVTELCRSMTKKPLLSRIRYSVFQVCRPHSLGSDSSTLLLHCTSSYVNVRSYVPTKFYKNKPWIRFGTLGYSLLTSPFLSFFLCTLMPNSL